MLKVFLLGCILFLSNDATMAQNQTVKKYKLVVKFGSYASGVPSEEPLLQMINDFKAAHKIQCFCVDKIGPLGREGEYNLAFTLSELNKKQTAAFISAAEKAVASMTDNGHATIEKDWVMNKDDLPQRATIQAIHL